MQVSTCSSLEEIPAREWNALPGTANPFLRHEFLCALERHGAVGRRFGWIPQHLIARAADGTLLGAVPMYLKDNSYGEFVFDWAWADAYERAGGRYYPKLVVAIPYTPAAGPRILAVGADPAHTEVKRALADAALSQARASGISSLHWLFTEDDDNRVLADRGLLRRAGCQFHWHNAGYEDFDDFLRAFTSERRKKVRRERRKVAEAGVQVRVVHGHEASAREWDTIHRFYETTFRRRGGVATLSRGFFEEVGRTLGQGVVLLLASHHDRDVAGAICYRSDDTLYGRHWGCDEDFDSLHFEVCYYRGLDYCIRHGLQRFEPGAQGEHKIWRGFLPTATWSMHWIADPHLRDAVARFVAHEEDAMTEYMKELNAHTPFRQGG